MAIALIILADLLERLKDLEAFYANTGVAPLEMVFKHCWNSNFISFHAVSGLWQAQLIIFLFAFLCGFLLLIGFRTQLFTVLSWVMMLSLHNRNVLILQGGDDLLRMVLFWAIFIPWGKKYSFDSLNTITVADALPIRSIALMGYLLQISYVYTSSALLKGAEWHTDFTAIYYAYSIDQIAYPITQLVYRYPDLLKCFTAGAFYFELLTPLLFFIPYKHAFFRTLGVVLIIGFHSINLFTLFIGLFPFIGVAVSLGLLPSSVMHTIEKHTENQKWLLSRFVLSVGSYAGQVVSWQPIKYGFSPFWSHLKTVFLIFVMVYIFDWNLSNIAKVPSKMPQQVKWFGYVLRLDQNWGMFAPAVLKDDGWFVYEGITSQNKHVDVRNPDKAMSYDKPKHVVATMKSDRWRKYGENLILAHNAYMQPYLCNYEKRVWNDAHPESKLDTLKIIFMSELSLPDYKLSTPEKRLLWMCW